MSMGLRSNRFFLNTHYSILITNLNIVRITNLRYRFLQKGGVPATPSGTATLLRLNTSYQFYP